MRVVRLCFALVLAVAAVAVCDVPAVAQLPPAGRWSTIESRHFRITYQRGLDDLARHAAASAERAHAALKYMVAKAPPGTIDIVVTDNVDFSNGYATPFPNNRIVVYAKSPVDLLELQYTRDWIELVITHELAHIFHMDVSSGFGWLVRAIFGRVPAPWPVFPVVGTPLWGLEGLAVGIESNAAGLGRLHGSYHEMVVRTAALEDEIDDIHRLGSTSPVWPGGPRVYIYGSLFMDYLSRRYGPDATARLVRSTASAVVPPPLWYGDVARRALGVTFQQAYDDWRTELTQRYTRLSAHLRSEGLTEAQPLTSHGRIALYPRFSPDSRTIAYASSDGRRNPRTTVIDAASGHVLWERTRNDAAPASWLPDGRLITSDLQYTDRYHVFSDLYTLEPGDRDRLTRGDRLQDADASPDGSRIVAVENGGGTNRLVLVHPATRAARPLTPFAAGVQWTLPRWGPAGNRIAVSRWQTGGRLDVVVIDTLGRVLFEVTDGTGVNTGATWSPDGRWVLYASDRTGISNLYAAEVGPIAEPPPGSSNDIARARIRQVTNVLTGAFYPDVSPDGRWIAYAAYHHDGYRIERMPFEPAHWREPQPGSLATLAETRERFDTQIRPAEFAESVNAAMVRADTSVTPADRYRPLRHLRPYFWLPLIESYAEDTYYGLFSFGQDLVGRHEWFAEAGFAPASGRTIGDLTYRYRGLPTLPVLDLAPTLALTLERDWDVLQSIDSLSARIDEHEDRAELALGLTRARWRMSTGVTVATELVRRARSLHNLPGRRLIDPSDDLIGLRGSTSIAAYSMPAFAISRENGLILQLGARQRWDRHPLTAPTQTGGTTTIDQSYHELTSWNAGYLALPLGGFSRHVLAARFSTLLRGGPGASTSGIGGVSGDGVRIAGFLDDIGGSSRLLPVRGFPSNARRGTRAWTASADYRFPVTLVTSSLAPLPIFVDRLAGSLFADAGHAWCSDARPLASCVSTSAADAPLVSVGAELTSFLSLWGAGLPVRFGVGIPVQGGKRARTYLTTGIAF